MYRDCFYGLLEQRQRHSSRLSDQMFTDSIGGEFINSSRRGRNGFFGRGGIIIAILDLIREQSRHGYDIIQEIEERSGGFYSPSPGVVYPTLQALEDRDFAEAAETEGKRIFSITEAGKAWLDEREEEVRSYRERLYGGRGEGDRAETIYEMKGMLRDMAKATRIMASDPERIREIRTVIKESKEKIDEILSR